jgi:hypothetical protein
MQQSPLTSGLCSFHEAAITRPVGSPTHAESERTEIEARPRTIIIGAMVVRRRCVIRTAGIIPRTVIRPAIVAVPPMVAMDVPPDVAVLPMRAMSLG